VSLCAQLPIDYFLGEIRSLPLDDSEEFFVGANNRWGRYLTIVSVFSPLTE
jgi:hypothetical protein